MLVQQQMMLYLTNLHKVGVNFAVHSMCLHSPREIEWHRIMHEQAAFLPCHHSPK